MSGMGIFGGMGQERERRPGEIVFHPLHPAEYNLPQNLSQMAQQFGFRPKHRAYTCGKCGDKTTGRVLCDLIRERDGAIVSWCICSCGNREPTVIIEQDNVVVAQYPLQKEFHAGENWPEELGILYEEASKAFSAKAFTACAMVCRKLLMATACDNGDSDGKNFTQYVDHITDVVLTFPKAKDSINKIRTIGNVANHDIAFVSEVDARRAMQIVTYMLNTIYSLPSS